MSGIVLNNINEVFIYMPKYALNAYPTARIVSAIINSIIANDGGNDLDLVDFIDYIYGDNGQVDHLPFVIIILGYSRETYYLIQNIFKNMLRSLPHNVTRNDNSYPILKDFLFKDTLNYEPKKLFPVIVIDNIQYVKKEPIDIRKMNITNNDLMYDILHLFREQLYVIKATFDRRNPMRELMIPLIDSSIRPRSIILDVVRSILDSNKLGECSTDDEYKCKLEKLSRILLVVNPSFRPAQVQSQIGYSILTIINKTNFRTNLNNKIVNLPVIINNPTAKFLSELRSIVTFDEAIRFRNDLLNFPHLLRDSIVDMQEAGHEKIRTFAKMQWDLRDQKNRGANEKNMGINNSMTARLLFCINDKPYTLFKLVSNVSGYKIIPRDIRVTQDNDFIVNLSYVYIQECPIGMGNFIIKALIKITEADRGNIVEVLAQESLPFRRPKKKLGEKGKRKYGRKKLSTISRIPLKKNKKLASWRKKLSTRSKTLFTIYKTPVSWRKTPYSFYKKPLIDRLIYKGAYWVSKQKGQLDENVKIFLRSLIHHQRRIYNNKDVIFQCAQEEMCPLVSRHETDEELFDIDNSTIHEEKINWILKNFHRSKIGGERSAYGLLYVCASGGDVEGSLTRVLKTLLLLDDKIKLETREGANNLVMDIRSITSYICSYPRHSSIEFIGILKQPTAIRTENDSSRTKNCLINQVVLHPINDRHNITSKYIEKLYYVMSNRDSNRRYELYPARSNAPIGYHMITQDLSCDYVACPLVRSIKILVSPLILKLLYMISRREIDKVSTQLNKVFLYSIRKLKEVIVNIIENRISNTGVKIVFILPIFLENKKKKFLNENENDGKRKEAFSYDRVPLYKRKLESEEKIKHGVKQFDLMFRYKKYYTCDRSRGVRRVKPA